MRWPFQTKPPENPLATRVERLESRLRELEHIEVEWMDMYDKFTGLLKRWQKRDRDALKSGTEAQVHEPAEAPINPMALRLLNREIR